MMENEKKSICGLNFLKEKLYNGIYADRLDCIDSAIYALKEIHRYREIGTVEECREAVEKQEPKKPEVYTDTVQTINGSFQRDVFECPVCGEYICNVEDEIPRYCSSCGQKLEESEE